MFNCLVAFCLVLRADFTNACILARIGVHRFFDEWMILSQRIRSAKVVLSDIRGEHTFHRIPT